MDVPSPHMFDRAAQPLTAMDYATLRAILVSRRVTEAGQAVAAESEPKHAGDIADRIDFFAGRVPRGVRPSGPFVPLSGFLPKSKGAVYLGGSTSGRELGYKKLLTPGAAMAARSGEKP